MIENHLNKSQCEEIGWRIVTFFDDYSNSDPFGWDWPTMRMLFPAKVSVFQRLRTRYQEIKS